MLTREVSNGDQRFIFIVAALMFFAIPIPYPDPETRTQREFRNFIMTFNRTYHGNTTEYQKRYQIFKNAFEQIEDFRHDNHPVFGINRYADMSKEEFSQRYLLADPPSRSTREISTPPYEHNLKYFNRGAFPMPSRVDWRERGIITPIRNQTKYGSSNYVHSVIGTVEAMLALKWNLSFAEEFNIQQVIDCAGRVNSTCEGGDTCRLLEFLKSEKITILPKWDYEYPEQEPHDTCHMVTTMPRLSSAVRTARVVDFSCYSFVGHESEMLAFLASKGPLIASVNALPWKYYIGGVIKTNCKGSLNHAVQIVGYDLDGHEEPHYIVKNSWGSEFGHDGYVKIAIGGNVCGIAEEVASVTVD